MARGDDRGLEQARPAADAGQAGGPRAVPPGLLQRLPEDVPLGLGRHLLEVQVWFPNPVGQAAGLPPSPAGRRPAPRGDTAAQPTLPAWLSEPNRAAASRSAASPL